MVKQELEELYETLGNWRIDYLYAYSCLLASGFDRENAYYLVGTLRELWLKDENNYGISKLSDMLFNIFEEYKDELDDMLPREILGIMYMYED